ncbi:hypothetical protein [Frateuria defendens]|uniref:hypothetical protein n=1 Tax=Frateuria defendens TaxID=2219559 RepID=UPI00066FF7CF|nr:hypothetical protein [Frateuria defendens]
MRESDRQALYPIRVAGLREQLRDTYRVCFLTGAHLLLALLYIYGRGVWQVAAVGAFFGMLPSTVLGQPARLRLRGEDDRRRLDAYIGRRFRRYRRGAQGWAPQWSRWSRWCYFDGQIVRYEGEEVSASLVILRQLRKVLCES